MTSATKGSGPKWVGRAMRRLEDPALVQGRGRFTADLAAAYAVRFVRSPVASGRIVAIAAPDGAPIVTGADLAGVRPIAPMLHKFNYRTIAQPILAQNVVRFVGEPLAAVFAATAAEAEDIADQVAVEIEDWPALVDAREALKPGAPLVHDNCAGNVVVEGVFATPEFDVAMAQAKRRIAVTLRSNRQNATPLETRCAHAAYDAASGRVTLTCATQMPHLMRTAIADVLGFPEAELRVVAPDVGGGFGQKMSLPPEYAVLVYLARRFRGTFAWSEDRRENLIASFHSRDQYVELEGGFDAAGKLIALEADIVANVGAYSCFPTTCGVEPLMAMAEMPGPYDLRAYSCRARGVTTHTCTMAPYRGVSRPVITLAIERLMDKAAAAFGIAPGRDPPAQSDRPLSLHFSDRPRVRRGQLPRHARDGGRASRPRGVPRPSTSGARGRALSRPRPRHLLRAHRLRLAGLRRARHGDHAGLGEASTSSWTPRASSRRASARARTAKDFAPRSHKSLPTKSASRRIRSA